MTAYACISIQTPAPALFAALDAEEAALSVFNAVSGVVSVNGVRAVTEPRLTDAAIYDLNARAIRRDLAIREAREGGENRDSRDCARSQGGRDYQDMPIRP